MKRLAAAALIFAASPLLAQQTGVSHPSDAVDEVPVTQTKTEIVTAPAVVTTTTVVTPAASPTGIQDSSSPAATLHRHDLEKFTPESVAFAGDREGDIVEAAPMRPGELPAGTLVRARLHGTIDTATTAMETPFSATLTEPVQHMGRVVFPAGSTVQGRVTEIHGGRRFRGPAMIHLQAQTLILPDGTRMPLNASVIDTDQYARTRTDGEGNIVRRDHATQTIAELSLATGSGAAAGGIFGGVPGALVGAGIGAGVGTVVWLKQDRQATLPNDTLLVLSLSTPAQIDGPERSPELVRRDSPPTPVEPATPAAPAYKDSFVPAR